MSGLDLFDRNLTKINFTGFQPRRLTSIEAAQDPITTFDTESQGNESRSSEGRAKKMNKQFMATTTERTT